MLIIYELIIEHAHVKNRKIEINFINPLPGANTKIPCTSEGFLAALPSSATNRITPTPIRHLEKLLSPFAFPLAPVALPSVPVGFHKSPIPVFPSCHSAPHRCPLSRLPLDMILEP